VGAGKTVICAAFLAREKRRDETSPARDGSSDTRDGSSDDFDGNTLVVCPAHIVTQWLEALRRFAPNLRCRRADAGDIGEINGLKASDSSDKVDCTFNVEDRRGIDDAADWDVIVCAHEDVPEVYVRGSSGGSNPGPSGGKTRTHPLWDYDFVGPVTKDGDEAENKQVKNGIRWRRLIVDEPQELDFTWRLNRYSGNGVWLTTVLNAKHRWALTATPYVTGDGARDVASLTFGTVSLFSYSLYVLIGS
jgi:SNF2 family DNA or RNA helicase